MSRQFIVVAVVSNMNKCACSDLFECVEDSLRISVIRVQSFGFLEGDDWLLKLL